MILALACASAPTAPPPTVDAGSAPPVASAPAASAPVASAPVAAEPASARDPAGASGFTYTAPSGWEPLANEDLAAYRAELGKQMSAPDPAVRALIDGILAPTRAWTRERSVVVALESATPKPTSVAQIQGLCGRTHLFSRCVAETVAGAPALVAEQSGATLHTARVSLSSERGFLALTLYSPQPDPESFSAWVAGIRRSP